MLESIEILGLRGFASPQALSFAVPNGTLGSGLTILVGANNAGKSTTIEALRAICQRSLPSFTQGRRNQVAGDLVNIKVTADGGKTSVLKSLRPGSSETELAHENDGVNLSSVLILPSRRVFSPYFGRQEINRDQYMAHMGFPVVRTSPADTFSRRLFRIDKNRGDFDTVLAEVLDPVPNWSIDQMDNGEYFLKIRKGDVTHSSEGLGEGLVSLLYIIDALYDSQENDTIVIDEPELSLHPSLQRKLSSLLIKYAQTRQIILATHSPYFARLDVLPNGATVARVHLVDEESVISQLSPSTATMLSRLLQNQNNPHILGLNAQEIFFIEDRVILVEGQEDVIFYSRVEQEIGKLRGFFFGWGVGGADNMRTIATLLREIGFSKVVGILDGDQAELATALASDFPAYHFFSIPANDVRTKRAAPARTEVTGLLDDDNVHVRAEFADETRRLFEEANQYLTG